MAYLRKKNPQGVKSTSLRTQFRNALRNAERRVVSDVAFSHAVSGLIGGNLPKIGLFKHLTYNEIYETGITRKVGNKTVRYTGEEAIKLQIQSLNRFGSKTVQAEGFIQNYISTMRKVGFYFKDINLVSAAMYAVPIDYLTYLIKRGPVPGGLPSIELVYAQEISDEDQRQMLLLEILQALTYDTTAKARIKEIRQRRSQLFPILQQQLKVQGHLYHNNTL